MWYGFDAMKTLLLALFVIGCLGCGASDRAVMRQMAEGSCQQQCADENPDSLYDRNRCLEECQPPR